VVYRLLSSLLDLIDYSALWSPTVELYIRNIYEMEVKEDEDCEGRFFLEIITTKPLKYVFHWLTIHL